MAFSRHCDRVFSRRNIVTHLIAVDQHKSVISRSIHFILLIVKGHMVEQSAESYVTKALSFLAIYTPPLINEINFLLQRTDDRTKVETMK